jgi:hypothetical protein
LHKVACKLHKVACKFHKVACKLHKVACKLHKVACKLHKVACKLHKVACKLHTRLTTLHFVRTTQPTSLSSINCTSVFYYPLLIARLCSIILNQLHVCVLLSSINCTSVFYYPQLIARLCCIRNLAATNHTSGTFRVEDGSPRWQQGRFANHFRAASGRGTTALGTCYRQTPPF